MSHPTTEEQLDTLREKLNSPSTPQDAKEAIERAMETITKMPRKGRSTHGGKREGAGRKALRPGQESIKTSIVLPRPIYEEVDRYRRSLGWRSMSSFLSAAAEFAIEQRLENPDTTPTRFDRLGQDGPDEIPEDGASEA